MTYNRNSLNRLQLYQQLFVIKIVYMSFYIVTMAVKWWNGTT